MATLIHLDGPSGVGKTTLAQRYVDEHPGVLNCDIDRLRTMVGGWQHDFVGVGAIVLPVALSMIGAHLAGGRDVVLPQMLLHAEERDAFRSVATDAGHRYLRLVLIAPAGVARARFDGRGRDEALHAVIGSVVDERGGAGLFAELEDHFARASDAIPVEVGGDVETSYRSVLAAIEDGPASTSGGIAVTR